MKLIGKVLIHMYGLVLEWGLGKGGESEEIAVLISRNFVRLDSVEGEHPSSDPDVTGESGVLFYGAGTPLLVASRLAGLMAKGDVQYEYVDLDGNVFEPNNPIDWEFESRMWAREDARNKMRRNEKNGGSAQDESSEKAPF